MKKADKENIDFLSEESLKGLDKCLETEGIAVYFIMSQQFQCFLFVKS